MKLRIFITVLLVVGFGPFSLNGKPDSPKHSIQKCCKDPKCSCTSKACAFNCKCTSCKNSACKKQPAYQANGKRELKINGRPVALVVTDVPENQKWETKQINLGNDNYVYVGGISIPYRISIEGSKNLVTIYYKKQLVSDNKSKKSKNNSEFFLDVPQGYAVEFVYKPVGTANYIHSN